MPGFFKSPRVDAIASSKLGRYVVYALGEILLIFVGITLAISFENATESRKKEELNLGLIEGVRQSLEANVDQLTSNLEEDEGHLNSLVNVINAIDSSSEWSDSLSLEFTDAMYWTSPFLATAGYESLKQAGLHNVKDPVVRTEMIHLFEKTYAFLIGDLDKGMWSYNDAVLQPMVGELIDVEMGDDLESLRTIPIDFTTEAERRSVVSKLQKQRFYLTAGQKTRGEALKETEALLSKLERFLMENE